MNAFNPNNNAWPSNGFRTNDVVHLCGAVDSSPRAFLDVNGLALPLNRRQFLVMLALVCHSLALAGLAVPMKTPPHPFLSAKLILGSIEELLDSVVPRPKVYADHPIDLDIIRVVNQIRDALTNEGLNPLLIQPGPRKRGYRLGTPPRNVTLIFIEPGGRSSITISGSA